jgi:hypothetical protein
MSLVTCTSETDLEKPLKRDSVYRDVKALFGLVQSFRSPSLDLIQAHLLLAMFEYAQGMQDAAYMTIATCARMGYICHLEAAKYPKTETEGDGTLSYGEAEEQGNTWRGIKIYER